VRDIGMPQMDGFSLLRKVRLAQNNCLPLSELPLTLFYPSFSLFNQFGNLGSI